MLNVQNISVKNSYTQTMGQRRLFDDAINIADNSCNLSESSIGKIRRTVKATKKGGFLALASLLIVTGIHALKNARKNKQNSNNTDPSYPITVGGIGAGFIVRNLIHYSAAKIRKLIDKKLMSINFSPEDYKAIVRNFPKALEIAQTDECGVKIVRMNPNADIPPYEKSKIMIKEGRNACFSPGRKKIILPPDKKSPMQMAVFHEIGHSNNYFKTTILKFLQRARPLTYGIVPITIIAMCKNKKAENEKPVNNFDKTTDFIKNNAGKLSFAIFIPTLIEEAAASIKGNKIARTLLQPELAQKVVKLNKTSYLTYLLSAVTTSLGVYAGTKVRDKVIHQKDKNKNL